VLGEQHLWRALPGQHPTTGSTLAEVAPCGGVKESGGGQEGSKYGMDDCLAIKNLCLSGIDC
jgi:acyl-CoA reductase-like NAD-dependent aldehyde dehydrogenase